jgi:hypothetical protein
MPLRMHYLRQNLVSPLQFLGVWPMPCWAPRASSHCRAQGTLGRTRGDATCALLCAASRVVSQSVKGAALTKKSYPSELHLHTKSHASFIAVVTSILPLVSASQDSAGQPCPPFTVDIMLPTLGALHRPSCIRLDSRAMPSVSTCCSRYAVAGSLHRTRVVFGSKGLVTRSRRTPAARTGAVRVHAVFSNFSKRAIKVVSVAQLKAKWLGFSAVRSPGLVSEKGQCKPQLTGPERSSQIDSRFFVEVFRRAGRYGACSAWYDR